MPYHVGAKGSSGCSGYPAVKTGTGEVMGCHQTRAQAAAQIYAINRSEGKIGKSMVKEGDMVMAPNDDEVYVGRVVHVMTDGMLGFPGSEYALPASPEEPAVLIQLFEMEEGGLEETEYFVGKKASEVMAMPSLEENVGMDKVYQGCGCETCKELNVDCENCPVCSPESMDVEEMDKAKGKPNYGDMIKPRRGGSTPANPRLYAAVVQAAKDKFDVYPSAVANGWVVQEYKRRGGTYKGEGMTNENNETSTYKTMWGGSIFDLNPFAKRDYTLPQRRRMAATGEAMPDGSYPIANKQDLMNAIRSWGRGGSDPKVKAFIMRRARALGAEDMIPENWK